MSKLLQALRGIERRNSVRRRYNLLLGQTQAELTKGLALKDRFVGALEASVILTLTTHATLNLQDQVLSIKEKICSSGARYHKLLRMIRQLRRSF